MLRRIGTSLGLVGSGSGLAGSLWHMLLPTLDANIGAGALVVLGLPLAVAGGALIVLSVTLGRRRPRSSRPTRLREHGAGTA